MAEPIKSIRLDELRHILYQEDSVIAADDVPLLLEVIVQRVASGQLIADRGFSWEEFQGMVAQDAEEIREKHDDGKFT